MVSVLARVPAMSWKSKKCRGNPFPHDNVREMSGEFGPICSFREVSGESGLFH